jgi:DNA-binding response OmpR family regulator
MARILLLGLEQPLAEQLGRILQTERHQVLTAGRLDSSGAQADVIFSAGDGGSYKHSLAEARRACPGVPFVVVTRLPETSQWLDALEAGATDYCAVPFEHQQIRWILETALQHAA